MAAITSLLSVLISFKWASLFSIWLISSLSKCRIPHFSAHWLSDSIAHIRNCGLLLLFRGSGYFLPFQLRSALSHYSYWLILWPLASYSNADRICCIWSDLPRSLPATSWREINILFIFTEIQAWILRDLGLPAARPHWTNLFLFLLA